MKISGGMKEDGIVVGNTYDKYGSQNPIVKRMMKGFDNALFSFVQRTNPQMIHEIGCGEGRWVLSLLSQGINARGSDFSSQVIELAKKNAIEKGLSTGFFKQCSIYEIRPGIDSADLIVCCEVMEHLEQPQEGLRALQTVANEYVVLSVPREPIWRVLNMIRGKYLKKFGNTPGHIQHWSRSGFIKLVSQYFEIIDVKTPFPWTMILCRVKK